jgi:hypothetical protein
MVWKWSLTAIYIATFYRQKLCGVNKGGDKDEGERNF